jgi:hypothetical protein
MVAVGCRVVTHRGLVPIEFVMPGDSVLTHRARFRIVRDVKCNVAEGTFACLGKLKITDDTAAARNWDSTFSAPRWLGAYEAVSAVSEEDWNEAERRSVTLDERPRGMVITTTSPQIVLGISPEKLFGRILFASAIDAKVERDQFDFQDLQGVVVVRLEVEEDDSYVCERLAIRPSRG